MPFSRKNKFKKIKKRLLRGKKIRKAFPRGKIWRGYCEEKSKFIFDFSSAPQIINIQCLNMELLLQYACKICRCICDQNAVSTRQGRQNPGAQILPRPWSWPGNSNPFQPQIAPYPPNWPFNNYGSRITQYPSYPNTNGGLTNTFPNTLGGLLNSNRFPTNNGGFPMTNVRFPTTNGGFPTTNNGIFPNTNGGIFPNTNGGIFPNTNGGVLPNNNNGVYPNTNGGIPNIFNGGNTNNNQLPYTPVNNCPYNNCNTLTCPNGGLLRETQ